MIDDELEMSIQRALTQHRVLEENENLKTQLDLRFGMDNVVGSDHRMRKIFDVIDSVADTRATVLITGESGTGKSMIARAIHRRSARRDRPFVEVACGALPETLLESELFGHVAGAFTGATGEKMGKFKQADGGSIFLDEVGTASMGMQVKLLRVLQDFEFEQVGAQKLHRHARVILATNDNLDGRIGRPLRQTSLPHQLHQYRMPPSATASATSPVRTTSSSPSAAKTARCRRLHDAAMAALQAYHWPGNVRELQTYRTRRLLANGRPSAGNLPPTLSQNGPIHSNRSAPERSKAASKPRTQITARRSNFTTESSRGRRALGINRTTLYKKM